MFYIKYNSEAGKIIFIILPNIFYLLLILVMKIINPLKSNYWLKKKQFKQKMQFCNILSEVKGWLRDILIIVSTACWVSVQFSRQKNV